MSGTAPGSEPSLPILHFPDWECLPYDVVSPHQGIVSERLETLYRLPTLTRGILLAAAGTLMHRIAPREYVTAHSFLLRRGERLDVAGLRTTLTHAGYAAVSQVMEPGEFAVRGGVIDLFPTGNPAPYRLDLFSDEVESIREFDPANQRSGRSLEEIRLLPAREFPLTDEAIQRFRQSFRTRFEGDPQKTVVYRDVSKGLAPAGVEYYLPLFFPQTATIFDYLPASTICLLEADVEHAARDFEHETGQRYQDLRHDRERPLLAPEEIMLTAAQFQERLREKACASSSLISKRMKPGPRIWWIKSWPMTPRRHPRFPWTTNLKNPTARYSIISMGRTSACCWWRKRREGGKHCGNYCGRAGGPLPTQPHGMTFCVAMRTLVLPRQTSNAACDYRHWASASSPNRNSTASVPCSGAGAERRAIPRPSSAACRSCAWATRWSTKIMVLGAISACKPSTLATAGTNFSHLSMLTATSFTCRC